MTMRIRPLLLSAAVAASFAASPMLLAQDKSSQFHQAMSKSMQEMKSMQMTGDIDRDFATMMKHHHQSGVDMARIQARDGKDPEMRQQAQKIIDAQTKEIAELDRWLQSKGSAGSGSSPSGSGQSSSHSEHGPKK